MSALTTHVAKVVTDRLSKLSLSCHGENFRDVTVTTLGRLPMGQLSWPQLWVVLSSHGENVLVVEPDNMDNFESDNHKVVTIDYSIDNCSTTLCFM